MTHNGRDAGPADRTLTRRQALQSFGAVSLAAALDLTPPQVQRALEGMATLESEQQPSYTPRFFTPAEWRTVRVLVDYIIPKDDRSGSATDAKVPEFMDWLLADREASESSKVSMRGGLRWLDNEARDRFSTSFVGANDAQRRAILDDIAWPAKAPPHMTQGVAFFNRMRDFTASGFFSSAMGWQDVQYIGNVSLPSWDGCPQPALDKLNVTYDVMNSRVKPQ